MSKWHEIEQVYKGDLIKKQKISKDIMGECGGLSGGELDHITLCDDGVFFT